MKARDENWREIPGFPYEVSDYGRVRNTRTGHVLTPMVNHQGYAQAQLFVSGSRSVPRINRLVLSTFAGPPPSPDHHANHKNGDKSDNRLANLEWVTMQENIDHAVRTGLVAKGVRSAHARLNPTAVRDIRSRASSGEPHVRLANEYGVSPRCIGYVVNRDTWRHVK